jgi:hypothetical protein
MQQKKKARTNKRQRILSTLNANTRSYTFAFENSQSTSNRGLSNVTSFGGGSFYLEKVSEKFNFLHSYWDDLKNNRVNFWNVLEIKPNASRKLLFEWDFMDYIEPDTTTTTTTTQHSVVIGEGKSDNNSSIPIAQRKKFMVSQELFRAKREMTN